MKVAVHHWICSSASVDTFSLDMDDWKVVIINILALGWQHFHAKDGRGFLQNVITICFSACNFFWFCPSNFPLLYLWEKVAHKP